MRRDVGGARGIFCTGGVPQCSSGEESGCHRPLASFKHHTLLQSALALSVLTTCKSNSKISRIPLLL